MFDNIGRKIKNLAKVIFWILSIGSVVAAVGMVCSGVVAGVILLAGPLVAWVSTVTLYGFGELIEKTTEIAVNTRGTALHRGGVVKSEVQIETESERIRKLTLLRTQGLITEDEYRQAMSKQH